uniref:Uncharacterized protein n=1 Tax=Panagrolaimus sp. PS1159 TaxID=55785 RepID=A0AC35F6V8_9BILA
YIRRTSDDQRFIDAMYDIQNGIADICCLTPIWFMILANKSLRLNIAATFGLIKSDSIVVSAVQQLVNSKNSTIAKSSSNRTNTVGTSLK